MKDKTLNVVEFPSAPPASNPYVVQRLEEALELAKSGGIESCAILLIDSNGGTLDCWANGGYKPFTTVGAIEALKRDFMNSNIEQR